MLTILEGNHFLVADDLGNVGEGVEGLYSADTRHLSRWRLLLDGRLPKLLSSRAKNYATAAVYAQHESGTVSKPSPLAAIRELFVSAGSFQERLVIENHAVTAAPVVVRYEFDADFLDLFEVKSMSFGERDLAFIRQITPLLTTRRYDIDEGTYIFGTEGEHFAASSLVWFSKRGVPGDRELNFEVEIAPRSAWSVSANIITLDGVADRQLRYPGTYFAEERRRVDDSLAEFERSAPRFDASVEFVTAVYRKAVGDLSALRMRTTFDHHVEELPAAGLPWFMTVFGRDTLLTSFQAMPLGDGLARAALRTLTALQAPEDDPERDAEPGKILHEIRNGKVAAMTGQFPYYGSVDATPLYLVLLSEAWRWSGDDELVRELEQPARRALRWMEEFGDLDGDGFLEFKRRSQRGLLLHCWKDSWDAMQFADGTLAEPPLAVAEVQGYAYDARLRTAEMARAVWDDEALATRLEAEAERLRARFDEAFWIERDGAGYYALALDAEKRPVDALTSNAGHVMWTGIARPERLAPMARLLFSERLFSGWGIRTMAMGEAGYNPIGYHTGTVWPHDTSFIAYGLARTGFPREAGRLALTLTEAATAFDWRLPEVIAGYPRDQTAFPVEYPTACSPQAWASGAPFLCLRAVLGLEPDPVARTLRIDPHLPGGRRTRLTWDGVRAFGKRFRVVVDGDRGEVETL
jgi:glycogen debranching enzyme